MGHLHAMRLGRDLTDMVLSLDQRHPADGLWTAAFTPAHATKFGPANEPAFVKVEDDADGIGLGNYILDKPNPTHLR